MRQNIILNGMNVNALGTNGSARVAVAGHDVRSLRFVRQTVVHRGSGKRLSVPGMHFQPSPMPESSERRGYQSSRSLESPLAERPQGSASAPEHCQTAWQHTAMPAAVWATFVVVRQSSF